MEEEYIDYTDQKKKRRKKILIFAMALILVGTITGTALGLYFYEKNKTPVTPTPTPEEIEKTRNNNIHVSMLEATNALLGEQLYEIKATQVASLNVKEHQIIYSFLASDQTYYNVDLNYDKVTVDIESILTELGNKNPEKLLNPDSVDFYHFSGNKVSDAKFDDQNIVIQKGIAYHSAVEASSEIFASGIYLKNGLDNVYYSYSYCKASDDTHIIDPTSGSFNEIKKDSNPIYYSYIKSLAAMNNL